MNKDSEIVLTECTILEEQTPNQKVSVTNDDSIKVWQGILLGGIPGILLGATGTKASEVYSSDDGTSDDALVSEEMVESESTGIPVASGVSEQMSFREAFEAARAEVGPGGAFCWRGNVYSTYRSDDPEWEAMTPAERNEHCQEIIEQVQAAPYSSSGSSHNSGSSLADDAADTNDVDVHIVGVGTIQGEDGSEINAGYGSVDGHQAVFADTDGDGLVDTVLIDTNDNGRADADEFFSAEGSGMTIGDLAAEAALNSGMPEDQLYADTPDYTNDADVSSLC